MTDFTDDDVTASQDPCRAGHEPHHMVSHGVPNGWIERCSICGMFDMTEYDAAIAARALREAANAMASAPGVTYADALMIRWLRARAEQVSGDE